MGLKFFGFACLAAVPTEESASSRKEITSMGPQIAAVSLLCIYGPLASAYIMTP
jgi:uncharacterized membrane protein YdfJ with MMPL/SSD domain